MHRIVYRALDSAQAFSPTCGERLREALSGTGFGGARTGAEQTVPEPSPPLDDLPGRDVLGDVRATEGPVRSRRRMFAAFGGCRQSGFLSEVEKLAEKGDLVRCRPGPDGLQQEYERADSALRMIPSTSWVLPLERA